MPPLPKKLTDRMEAVPPSAPTRAKPLWDGPESDSPPRRGDVQHAVPVPHLP
jgi:hypothetical protein